MIYLIWAQDEFLAAETADRFAAQAGDEDEVVSIECAADVEGLEEALFATSLFAAKRYVVIRKAEQLRKAGLDRLSDALHSADVPAEVAVFVTADRKPAQIMGVLEDVADTSTVTRPRRGQLVSWVSDRMKQAGMEPDRQAPSALIDAVGDGLRDLAQAVEQLALRIGEGALTPEHINEHFSKTGDQPIWVLFDAILRHEGPNAFGALRRILAQGDAPLAILGALISQVRYLIRAKSILERRPGLDERDLASALATSPGRAAVLRRQAGRLSWEWLLGVHRICADADFELKGGEDGAVLPAEIVLERVVNGALEAG